VRAKIRVPAISPPGRSFYHDVKCRQCKQVVGRRYISTPEALRELMCAAQPRRGVG
jgi:hypothetical protein